MASVHQKPGERYWKAAFRAWDGEKKAWRRVYRSTGIPTTQPKALALRVARTLEEAAAGIQAGTRDRAFYEATVAELWRLAGVEPPVGRHTFREAADAWLAEREVAPATRSLYVHAIERFLAASPPGLLVDHVDYETLSRYPADLARDMGGAAARRHLWVLRSILQRAVDIGWITANPAAAVRQRATPTFERRPFTADQARQILDHTRGRHPEWHLACLLGLHLGLRLGDAISRCADDVVTVAGVRCLRFIPQKRRRRGRYVQLPLTAAILAAAPAAGEWTPRLRAGGVGNVSHQFGRILEEAGIEVETVRAPSGRRYALLSFHSLRHTNKSLLVDAGVEGRLADAISDHEDQRVARAYTHASVTAMAGALDRVFGASGLKP